MNALFRVTLSVVIVYAAVGRVVAQDKKTSDQADRHIAELIAALKDKDNRDLRQSAFWALGPDGSYAKRALPFLIDALDTKDADDRDSLVSILADYGTPAVPGLIRALKRREASVRVGAAEALAGVRPRAVDAVPALQKLLKDEVPEVRRQAAASLGAVGRFSDKPVASLAAALKDKDPFVRVAAANSLGYLGRKAAPAVPELVAALKDKDESVRFNTIDALGSIGSPAKMAVPVLVEALQNDKDHNHRYRIAHALGGMGPAAKEAVAALIEVLVKDAPVVKDWPYEDARAAAIEALGAIGPGANAAVPHLLKIAQDKKDRDRRSAITSLGAIGPDAKAAVPALIEALEAGDKYDYTPVTVAHALGAIGPEAKAAVPKLIALARNLEAYGPVREAAANAVMRIDSELAAKEKMEFAYLDVRLGKIPDLKPAARAAVPAARKREIKALIALLAEVKEPDYGLSSSVTGDAFAPLPGHENFRRGILGGPRPTASEAFRRLVEIGPDALPFLLDALNDATPIALKLDCGVLMSDPGFGLEDKGNPFNLTERRVLRKKPADTDEYHDVWPATYQLRIGDVCFVAIGQIVGRPYWAILHGPGLLPPGLSSPVQEKLLREQVRALWSSDDPAKKLFDSLLIDYATERLVDGNSWAGWSESEYQIRAAMRLLYYFPKEAAPLIADRLKAFDVQNRDSKTYFQREAKNGVQTIDFIKAVSWCQEPRIQEALTDIAKRTDDKQIKELLADKEK